jgi:uncharacterized membrane protein (UPF0127 family)
MIVAGVIAAAALVGMVIIIVRAVGGSTDSSGGIALRDKKSAATPFAAFMEAHLALDSKCQRVLVASTLAQREQGLREVMSLGAYAGMLFVFPSDSDAPFTMAQTPLPLAIGWYSEHGDRVNSLMMIPCPKGSDATCPEYAAGRPYRYAFESTGGTAPTAIGACAS